MIFKKKLRGKKIGRNWYTTREWLRDYFQSIKTKKVIKDAVIDEVGYARHALENPPQPDFAKVEARLAAIADNLSRIQASLEKTVNASAVPSSEIATAPLAPRNDTLAIIATPHLMRGKQSQGTGNTRNEGARIDLLPHLRFIFKEALPVAALSVTIVWGGYVFATSSLPPSAVRIASDVAREYEDALKALIKSTSLLKSRFSESVISSLTFIKDGFEIPNFTVLVPRLEPQPQSISRVRPYFEPVRFSDFAFTLPSLPSLSLPSFFSELFKPSPPPPSEIAIPKREDAQNTDIQSTNKTQNPKPKLRSSLQSVKLRKSM